MPILQDGELLLYGFVGDSFWEEGFTSRDVIDALAEVGRDADLTVRINSGGGYAYEGIAIYNALANHKGKVTVQVDAVALSAASVIAMAGEEIRMLSGSLMMIHDAAVITIGNADDHEVSRQMLDKMSAQIASIYADQSGKAADAIRASMKAETWMTAEEAVAEGFATEAVDTSARAVAAFDYRAFAHAPKKLVALAKSKDWSLEKAAAARAAGAAHQPGQQENPMPDPTPPAALTAEQLTAQNEMIAAAVAADRKRRADILALPEAKGREALAESLIDTPLSVEQIKSSLAAAPAPQAAADTSEEEENGEDDAAAAKAYETQRAAAAGLAKPTDKGGTKTEKVVNRVLGNYRALTGKAQKTA
jgi:ATP-dependent protease ClpP protease subunit